MNRPISSQSLPPGSTNVLGLNEIAHVLQQAFDKKEWTWARDAWQSLVDHHLADCGTELERCRSGIRFIGLLDFYADWYEIAFEDTFHVDYAHIAQQLMVLPHLSLLIGDKPEYADYEHDAECLHDALRFLAHEVRSEIVAALKTHYGNTSGFFVALWNSNKLPRPTDFEAKTEKYETERFLYQGTADEILNESVEEKLAAWMWLEQGAGSLDD